MGAVIGALDIIEREPERREALWGNTRYFMQGLKSLGYDTGEAASPIIPAVVGEDMMAFRMVRRLQDLGVFANPVISPATAPGRALIRNSLMATHTTHHLDKALSAFQKAGREFGIIP